MTGSSAAASVRHSCRVTVDGREILVRTNGSLLAAMLEVDVYVPHLCHHPSLPAISTAAAAEVVFRIGERVEGMRSPETQGAVGCGLCIVEVEGESGPQRACELSVAPGLVVRTDTAPLRELRRARLAEILALHPHACLTCAQRHGCSREPCSANVPVVERCCPLLGRCELEKVADYVGIPPTTPRYLPRGLPADGDDPLYAWEPELCIGCLRCVRACSALTDTGAKAFVVTPGEICVGLTAATRAEAGCRYCGACVEVCPTGALLDRGGAIDLSAPCRVECPAGMDVPRFFRAVAAGNGVEAANVALDRLPLPAVLGRVCFHPCEGACRRTPLGGALSVCQVRRSVFEEAFAGPNPWPTATDTGRRVAIVGSGPAGLAAAHFLARQGHRVVVIETAPEAGGMLRYGIPAYRLPRGVLGSDVERLSGQGIEFRFGVALGRDVTLDRLRAERFDAVLLAVGAGVPRRLDIVGENLEGVLHGVPFLRDVASGDAPQQSIRGRSVLVIGGGNVAVDAARTAVRLGAVTVTMACLEPLDEMPAWAPEVAAARAEGVTILDGWGPEQLLGAGEKVRSVRLVRCVSVFDRSGRFAPRLDSETAREVEAEVVIVAVGQQTDAGLLAALPAGGSDKEGLFFCGDLRMGPSSVVRAIADARRVAEEIDRFLGGSGEISSILDQAPSFEKLPRIEGFSAMARTTAAADQGVPAREASLAEVEPALAWEAARAESGRCLQCDVRIQLASPVLPPSPWLELNAEALEHVPATPGVFQLLDEGRVALSIVGVPNLREALQREVTHGSCPPFFIYEEDAMFTKRESELIQQFLADHGRMPAGAGDDLDDLF